MAPEFGEINPLTYSDNWSGYMMPDNKLFYAGKLPTAEIATVCCHQGAIHWR